VPTVPAFLNLCHQTVMRPRLLEDLLSCLEVALGQLVRNGHGIEYALALEEDGVDLLQMAAVGLGEEEVDSWTVLVLARQDGLSMI